MVTMKEIARKAGVSRATVSRYINNSNYVDPEKAKKIKEWIDKLGYYPNMTAKILARKQSFLIGIMVPNIVNPYYSEVIHEVEVAAFKNGYNLLIHSGVGESIKEDRCVDSFLSRNVDGILIIPHYKTIEVHKRLVTSDTPVVAITRYIENFSSVELSHTRGGELAAEHLLEYGHRRIGYIGTTENEDKYEGFKKSIREGEVELDKNDIFDLPLEDSERSGYLRERFSEYFKRKKEERATAFFINTDITAFQVMAILTHMNYKVPEDISIIGFDNTFFAKEMGLTTIAQPIDEIAKNAISILLEKISDGNKNKINISVEPRLVIRNTTRILEEHD